MLPVTVLLVATSLSTALCACPIMPLSGRFGLDWGAARRSNLTGNNCMFQPGQPTTLGWLDSMCTVGELACIAPVSSTRKCTWVRCMRDADCRQDGADFRCGRVFLVEDSGLSQMHLLTLAPTPPPTTRLPIVGTAPPTTTLPPTPRPSATNENGACGVGLLDCACTASFECDKPGSCQREAAPLPSPTASNATQPPEAMNRFVCRCVDGNEGCSCIPSALSDRPCQTGLFCVDSKCSATRPPTVLTMVVTGADGSTIFVPAASPTTNNTAENSAVAPSANTVVPGLEDWQLGAIVGGGGLFLILLLVGLIVFLKRRGSRGYDYDAFQRNHNIAMQAPMPNGADWQQQQQQQMLYADEQLNPTTFPPSIAAPDALFHAPALFSSTGAVLPTSQMTGVQQVAHFDTAAATAAAASPDIPPPPAHARPLPVPIMPHSSHMHLQASHHAAPPPVDLPRTLPPGLFALPPPIAFQPPALHASHAANMMSAEASPNPTPRPMPPGPPPAVTVTPLHFAEQRPVPAMEQRPMPATPPAPTDRPLPMPVAFI
jgi:hypothetical protein